MAEPIRVDFQVGGIKDVLQALRTVTQAVRAMADSKKKALSEDEWLERKWIKANEKFANEFYDRQKREQRKRNAERIKTEKFVQGELGRIDDEILRGLQKNANARTRILKQAEADMERQARAANRTITKAFDRQNRQRIADKRRDAIAGFGVDYDGGIAAFMSNMDSPILRAFESIEKRKTSIVKREERERSQAIKRERENFARTTAGILVGSAGNAMSFVGRAAGMAAGILGGFSIADGVQQGIRARGFAADIENASNHAVKASEVHGQATRVAMQLGQTPEEVQAALRTFVAVTGEAKTGLSLLPFMAQVASATGVDTAHLGTLTGRIFSQTNNMADTKRMVGELAGMARAFSLDLPELAEYAPRLLAPTNKFTSREVAFRQLSAIGQMAPMFGSSTTPAEATMSVLRLISDIETHQDELDVLKIKPYDKTGMKLRNPADILMEAVIAANGDTRTLREVFKERSYRAVEGFENIYKDAVLQKKDPRKAMQEAMQRFSSPVMTEAQITSDAYFRAQQPDRQINRLMLKFHEIFAVKFIPLIERALPALERLAPDIEKFAKAIGDFVSEAVNHPWNAAFKLMAIKFGADLTSAGAGILITKAIEKVILSTGVGAGAGVAAGATGAAGTAGLVGTVAAVLGTPAMAASAGALAAAVAAGLLPGYLVNKAGETNANPGATQKTKVDGATKELVESSNLLKDLRENPASVPQDRLREEKRHITNVLKGLDKQTYEDTQENNPYFMPRSLLKAWAGLSGTMPDALIQDNENRRRYDEEKKVKHEELIDALQKLTYAMEHPPDIRPPLLKPVDPWNRPGPWADGYALPR